MQEFEQPKISRSHIARSTISSIASGVTALFSRDYGEKLMAEGKISQTFQELGQADITFVEKILGYMTIPAIPLGGMKLLLMMFGPRSNK